MLSVKTDFGAVGDGITDDTAALQAACNSGSEVYLDQCVGYKITSTLNVTSSVSLIGPKTRVKILPTGNLAQIFNIQAYNVAIEGIYVNNVANTTPASTVFYLNNNSTFIGQLSFFNIQGTSCCNIFIDAGNPKLLIVDVKIKQCYFTGSTGRGILFQSVFAFLIMDTVLFDSINASNNSPQITLINNQGCFASNVFIASNNVNSTGQYGWYLQNCAAIHLERCHVDTIGGTAYYFNQVSDSQFNHLTCGLMNQHGMICANMYNSIFTNVTIIGRRGVPPTAAGCIGLYVLSGCSDLIFNAFIILNMSGQASYITQGSPYVQVSNFVD